MSITSQIAGQFREVHFGGNWTGVNLKDTLAGVRWQQATSLVYSSDTEMHSHNTIAILVFHMNYYVSAVLKVLQGGTLDAHDKFSFDCPPIKSDADWEKLINKTWTDAENFALLVEQLPESKLWENMTIEKYGNYYRNLNGVIQHCHYHLGQIALIKKFLLQKTT